MNSDSYRRQLNAKRKQRVDAEKKVGEYSAKESKERAAAAKARSSAARANTETTHRSRMREAERCDSRAATAGTEAARWQTKASTYRKAESVLTGKLARAEQSERDATERRRQRDQRQADLQRATDDAMLQERVSRTEQEVASVMRELRAPKPEKLRVLILGSSSEGDLRVGREQARIRNAVQMALHRDLVEMDVRTSATTRDLLHGVTGFRPHVVHFSGHSGTDLLVFENDVDDYHEGVEVSAKAFTAAITATDDPPLLVLFNSCNSASQAEKLVGEEIPFAIGMSAEIDDVDAISYAAQFYATVADGQSIRASHHSGQAALQLAGLPGVDLPALFHAPDVDTKTCLVKHLPGDVGATDGP